MAYVEFEGPDGSGGRVVTRKTMPDEALIAVVQAVCATDRYTGDTPGLYVIDRTIGHWKREVESYEERTRTAEIKEEIAAAIEPLNKIKTTINGVSVDGV